MILIFRTDRSGQTVQTQRSSLIRVFTVCYSICIFLAEYPKVWPLCLNFRLITAKFSGIRKFRSFTVLMQIKTETIDNKTPTVQSEPRYDKTCFGLCENKGADQLTCIVALQLISAFVLLHYKDSTIPLLPKNFKPLTIFCGCTAWFVSGSVGNPKDRFSHDMAHLRSEHQKSRSDRTYTQADLHQCFSHHYENTSM